LKGILGVGIDIEGVVGVLSGSHIQAPCGKYAMSFSMSVVLPEFSSPQRQKRGCHGLSLAKELQPKVRCKMRI
jgi:hypothetical protein